MTKTITASILQKKTFRKTKSASLKCTSQKWLFCNSRVARKQKNLQPSQAQEQSIFAKFRWLNLQKCHFSMPILQFSLTLKLQNLWNVRLRSLFQSLYLRSLALARKSGIFLGEFFGRLTLFFFRFFLEDGRRYTYNLILWPLFKIIDSLHTSIMHYLQAEVLHTIISLFAVSIPLR